jgi:hypothetical protein
MNEELKASLITPHLKEDDVQIDGVGTVRVRALNRAEVLMLQRHNGGARERKMVALGMVDPVMTEAEVGAWTLASPSGELEAVTIRIAQLSGLAVTQDDGTTSKPDKEVYEEFEDDPNAEFRVLPGAETVNDGGGNAGAND